MSFMDKTFCRSPNCKNECGRKMTEEERRELARRPYEWTSSAYFCDVPEESQDNSPLAQR